MTYRPEIDGLRAVAVVPVILFHAEVGALGGGFVGVDVFFVISGYLITSIIVQGLERGDFSLADFYERRARRILPALFAVMLLCLPAAWFWMLPLQKVDFAESLIAASLFSSNFLFNHESGYFDAAAEMKPLLHTWSLAVEEQYYLLFPVVMMLSWRYCRRHALWVIAILAAASFVLSETLGRSHPVDNYYLAPARAWEILVGSMAAFVGRTGRIRGNDTLAFLGLGSIGLSMVTLGSSVRFPGVYALPPVLGTALVLVYARSGTYAARWLSMRALVFTGLISYSAYLLHQPLFAFSRLYVLDEPELPTMLLLIVATFWLATIFREFVEQPFRGGGSLLTSRRSVTLMSCAGIAFFCSIGMITSVNDGQVGGRFTRSLEGDISHKAFNEYLREHHMRCQQTSVAESAIVSEGFLRCYQTQPGTPEFVLLGDSHAEHLFPGLAEAMGRASLAYYIQAGKPWLDHAAYSSIFEELLGNGIRQTVLISFYYASRVTDAPSLRRELSRTIDALQKAGNDVILLGDVPSFPWSAQICVYGIQEVTETSNCTISRQDVLRQKRTYEHVMMELSEKYRIRYISVDGPLCEDRTCSMIEDNYVLYRDDNHLNVLGSRLVATHVMKALAAEESRTGIDRASVP